MVVSEDSGTASRIRHYGIGKCDLDGRTSRWARNLPELPEDPGGGVCGPVVPMCRRGCANLTQQREERSWTASGKEKTGRDFGFQDVLTAFTQPIKRQLGLPFMRKRLRIVGSIVARGNMPKCARDRVQSHCVLRTEARRACGIPSGGSLLVPISSLAAEPSNRGGF